ncbi:MAG: rhomboid family intramembrane serine protease [Thioalkalispiraceae bacterium]|jgi:membrane associated rhomboid family serine protease
MLIPLDRKPEWRNPPLVTLVLILVNILVYFGFQYNDEHKEQLALEYYFDSGLYQIELPRYQQYLYHGKHALSRQVQMRLFWEMQADGGFLEKLRNDQVITPGDSTYSEWKSKREYFDHLLNNIFSYRYSLKTADPSLLTIVSHMFLHADPAHLLGNMLFLFLFGFVVEITLGRSLFLTAYLASGVLSALFDIAINPGSGLWGLGASGAISGLAGMYTVLFGLRKIRFFYTLLFYFDYIKAPALIMLPFWLGYELYQQFMYPDSQINNLAHIGGLLAGALIAWLATKYSSRVNTDYLDQDEKADFFKQRYAEAIDKIAQLDFPAAKQIFKQLDENYPDNIDIQIQLFNLYKHQPENSELHHYANQVLSLRNIQRLPEKQLFDIYQEYINRSPRTLLKAEQLLSLAIRFANGSHIEEAEKIVLYLTQRKPEFKRNAEGLMTLINQFKKRNKENKYMQYFSILEKCYPGSKECQLAQQFINS